MLRLGILLYGELKRVWDRGHIKVRRLKVKQYVDGTHVANTPYMHIYGHYDDIQGVNIHDYFPQYLRQALNEWNKANITQIVLTRINCYCRDGRYIKTICTMYS